MVIIEVPKFRDLKSSMLAEWLRKIGTKSGAMKRGPFYAEEQVIEAKVLQ